VLGVIGENTMNYKEYVSTFKSQLDTLSYQKQVDLALTVCKKLYPDYMKFVEVHQWGDADLLMKAITLCERGQTGLVDKVAIEKMLPKVDAITPDMDDCGDEISSYGLNASAAVYETLQFLIDKDKAHIYNIGNYLTDTIDFRIQEERDLTEAEIAKHPMMLEAWNYVLTLSR
jgi:uncharacterized protein YjaG (DUF416 family)